MGSSPLRILCTDCTYCGKFHILSSDYRYWFFSFRCVLHCPTIEILDIIIIKSVLQVKSFENIERVSKQSTQVQEVGKIEVLY